MRSPATALSRGRLAVVRAALLAGFALLAVRAAHLSVVDERGADRGAAQQKRLLTLAPDRGPIVDRNGAELALTLDAPSIFAEPARIQDPGKTAAALARILDQDARELARRLQQGRFVFVARWVSEAQAKRVLALRLPGVGIQPEPRRVYPHGDLAGPVLGFANIDGLGVRGVEQQEEHWLRGIRKQLRAERDGSGRLLVSTGRDAWETAGGTLALTLDVALQAQVEAALRDAVKRNAAKGGFVVVMDPHSGELLAVAQWPGFDPNRFRETPFPATRATPFLDAPEPGSTFKTFLVAAALDTHAIRDSDFFDCGEGFVRVPGKTIRDSHDCEGPMRAADVLRVSSNIGAVKIAMALGPQRHYEMLRRFGFGERSGSDFPDESAGLLRDVRGWRPVDAATAAFGQGLNTTPIQLAAAMSAIANGGELVEPRLISARRAGKAGWRHARRELRRRVLQPATAARMLEMLTGVVSPEGTGSRAGLRGVAVAGKTGTAQKIDPSSGAYAPDRFVAWFIGAAPADAPRVVVVVGLDEPRRPHHTGGFAAAPLFAEAAAAQLNRLGIATAPERVVASKLMLAADDLPPPETAPPPATPPPRTPREPELPGFEKLGNHLLMPDLTGLTIAEVRSITEKNDVSVEISGRGLAIAQDPSPGTVVPLAARGAVLRVRFAPAGRGAG